MDQTYASSTLTDAEWAPEQRNWNDEAFEETRNAFFQVVVESHHQRAQAFALWVLAQQPTLGDAEVAAYQGGCPEGGPNPDQIVEARRVLGLDGAAKRSRKPAKSKAKPARKQKKLSRLEKSVLAELERAEKLVEAYRAAEQRVAKAQAELDQAKETLRALDPLERELMARHDEQLAALLQELTPQA